jgi:hypothetical protein
MPMNLSTISDLVHQAGEKAHAISTSKDRDGDLRQLADAVAHLAEAQLRLMEQLSRRPVGDGVPLGTRERRLKSDRDERGGNEGQRGRGARTHKRAYPTHD